MKIHWNSIHIFEIRHPVQSLVHLIYTIMYLNHKQFIEANIRNYEWCFFTE